ncbi:MAG: rod-binding protein [Rhodospirillaceae bacterium]
MIDAFASAALPQSDAAATAAASARARASKGASREQVAQVSQDFEAMFLSQMFQFMFEGLSADPEFGGGNAETMYRSLMIDEYGKQVAKSGGLGIADAVSRTLLAAQEGRAA